MADFEERITLDTAPAIRLEHEIRYRAARPLIVESQIWCDLGCGSGVAAASVLGERYPGRAVLVDVDEDAVRAAEARIEAAELHAFRADLTTEQDLTRVRDELFTDLPDAGCITCFEVIEHLTTFVPLLELLVDAAATGRYAVLLSVPNDAFWSMQNPYHESSWGDAALEELRRLLPDDHVLAQQVELRGSMLVRADREAVSEPQATFELPETAVASHFVVAFGPRSQTLAEPVQVEVHDRDAERMWIRQRESDLAYYRALAGDREAQVAATSAVAPEDAGVTPPAQ
jgi:SAM-dependent methyltransferase